MAPASRQETLMTSKEPKEPGDDANRGRRPRGMGGVVLIPALDPLRLISLPVPDDLWLALYTPGVSVATADARAVLPRQVSLSATVTQAARLGLLVHALHVGDLSLLGEAVVDDIVEPVRAHLIPGFLDANLKMIEDIARIDIDGKPIILVKPTGGNSHGRDVPRIRWSN